ncbi:MAG TPA: hypothetical protein VGO90_11330 [Chthoniobacteraceae bacterium]|jgi:hypothetical protein|nr:hypothetical protein [Chthoniobacteraceae bacterium]
MNDFEHKLAQQTFREPPRDLRRVILAAAEPTPSSTWREWLWPSPSAWGALAAVWLVFAALEILNPPTDAAQPSLADVGDAPVAPTLLTAHTPRELRRVLDLTN